MKIASLFTLPSGGATIAALRIAAALRAAGHECQCFALAAPAQGAFTGQVQGLSADKDVSSFWFRQVSAHWLTTVEPDAFTHGAEMFSDCLTALFPLQPFPEFLRQADVIHLHWVAGMLFTPSLLRLFRGKKVLFTLHDFNPFTGGCHYPPACDAYKRACGCCPLLRDSSECDMSRRSFDLKRRLYAELKPTFVAPSRWLADCAQSSPLLHGTTCQCIPNAMAPAFFEPLDAAESREQLGIPASDFVVLVGADSLENSRKNFPALVEALEFLAQDHPNAALTLVSYGSGTLPELPYPAHALGRLQGTHALAQAYTAADVYVHTALQDNLPNTLCEAQACGVPVVAFDGGGIKESFAPGVSGVLLQEPSPASLAQALAALMDDPVRCAAMRDAARSFARQRFDSQRVATQYENILAEMQPSSGILPAELWENLYANQVTSLAMFYKNFAENIHSQFENIHNVLAGFDARIGFLEKVCGIAMWRKLKGKFGK